MNLQRLQQKLPEIKAWVERTVAAHRPSSQPVASLKFPRLNHFFANETLARARVVTLPRVPMPPLISMGLPEFADFEQMNAEGITYLDIFFVQNDFARNESLHFHELVHIIQWRLLGPERFLMAYALGHLSGGYDQNPLEQAAYQLQARFDRNEPAFDTETLIRRHLESVVPALLSRTF